MKLINLSFIFSILFLVGCVTPDTILINESIEVTITDDKGNSLGTPENPLSTDEQGFLYMKDINYNKSNFGNFTGDTDLLFTDLDSGIIDNSSNPTKTILLRFKTPVQLAFIGLGCSIENKSFSNVKIELLGSGTPPTVILIIDQSQIDTKLTSKVPRLNPTYATGLRLTFNTADEICLTNINLEKIHTRKVIQEYSKKNVNRHFINFDSAVTTLNTSASMGDFTFDVISTVGFSVDDNIFIMENGFTEVDDITITAIDSINHILTLDRRIDNDYSISANIERVITNMAVVGTMANPVIYEVCANKGEIINIDRILFNMRMSTDSDDSRFGNIAGGLTNGVVITVLNNGKTRIIDNWKNNGDMRLTMYNVDDVPKQGGGQFGLSGRYTFTSQRFSPQLDGETNDCIQAYIQDNIGSLASFEIKAEGFVVTN